MKRQFVSLFSALLLMFVLTTTAFAAPTAEIEHVHIKGTVYLVETLEINPVTNDLSWTGNGSGKASLLGRFTDSFWVNPATEITHYHFVMANGDSLDSSGPGVGTDVGPNMGHVVETHTVTGGTGRFAGASGNLTIERLVTWTCICIGGVGTSSGTISGDIVLAEDH